MTSSPSTVATPTGARLARAAFDRWDYTDSYEIDIPPGAPTDPRVWTDAIFLGRPFPEQRRSAGELLTGDRMSILDFVASVLVDTAARTVTLTTVVKYRNRGGPLYFGMVRPVHRRITPWLLRRAGRRLARA